MTETTRKRIAVMISGRGSNMASIVEAAKAPDFPAQVVKVISNKPDAAGLTFAKENGIETSAFPRKDFDSNAAQEDAIAQELINADVDLICLAGYMRILSTEFVSRFSAKMINIHPSLLPLFTGLDTHQRALDAGVKVHGCTVHVVTATLDEGPIIAQAAVPVLPDDTEQSLAARVLKAEHKLYPAVLAQIAKGEITLGVERVEFQKGHSSADAKQMVLSI